MLNCENVKQKFQFSLHFLITNKALKSHIQSHAKLLIKQNLQITAGLSNL